MTIGRRPRRFRKTGSVAPLAMGGDRRSGHAQSLAGTSTGWIEAQQAVTIAEIRQRLAERGRAPGYGATWRLPVRPGYTARKVTVFAGGQNRPDVRKKRKERMNNRKALSRFRLICMDEFGISTKMARARGRALRGKRCVARIPHGHRKKFTAVAAPGPDGIIAFMIFDGAMNAERFRTWMEEPGEKLGPEDLAICANPAAHKIRGSREILQEKGADIRFLQPCSPDLNPIERAIAQMKSDPRKVEAGTAEDLQEAVEKAANRVTATRARNRSESRGSEIHAATCPGAARRHLGHRPGVARTGEGFRPRLSCAKGQGGGRGAVPVSA